jgi:hypothetical protein
VIAGGADGVPGNSIRVASARSIIILSGRASILLTLREVLRSSARPPATSWRFPAAARRDLRASVTAVSTARSLRKIAKAAIAIVNETPAGIAAAASLGQRRTS